MFGFLSFLHYVYNVSCERLHSFFVNFVAVGCASVARASQIVPISLQAKKSFSEVLNMQLKN